MCSFPSLAKWDTASKWAGFKPSFMWVSVIDWAEDASRRVWLVRRHAAVVKFFLWQIQLWKKKMEDKLTIRVDGDKSGSHSEGHVPPFGNLECEEAEAK